MAMKATIGRIVHYYTKDESKHFNGHGHGPYAAIVTQVFPESMANLKVFPSFAPPYDAGSVQRETDPVARAAAWQYWDWPPRDDGKSVA
jgi:hypothetical protein